MSRGLPSPAPSLLTETHASWLFLTADRVLAAEGAGGVEAELDAVAEALTRVHHLAGRSAGIDAAGAPEAIASLWQVSLNQCERYACAAIDPDTLGRVARLASRCVVNLSGVFRRRVADGRVCDGHADLPAEGILCLRDGPRILDPLEVRRGLRDSDVVSDVAFVAMDLERLGRADLAERFVAAYRAASGDRWPAALLHHWIAYHALVRSGSACIRADHGETDMADQARSLLDLALSHLLLADLRLVLIGGLPGTGRSTLAAALGRLRHWPVLHSESLRQELTALDSYGPADAPFGTGLYEADRTAAVYAELVALAGDDLDAGQCVVLDASWLRRCWRQAAARAARASGAALVELRCEAPMAAAAARIEKGQAIGQLADRWPEAIVIDTTGPPGAALEVASRSLELSDQPSTPRSSPCPPTPRAAPSLVP